MIEIRNDNTIVLSNGDDFDMVFVADKAMPLPSEPGSVKLEIKHDIRRDAIITGACERYAEDPEGTVMFFFIPEVERLQPGAYWYDLHFDEGGKRKTLNWPARLIIAEIAHDLN